MMHKTTTPEVSIVIPIYNAESMLSDCLNSVLSQHFKSMEILCINDGSKDNSGNILEEYARRDSRVHVIHQENQGAYATRNISLDLIQGRYVLFLDCDDELDSTYVEKLVYRAEAENADITITGWDYLSGPYRSPDVTRWNLRSWKTAPKGSGFPMSYGYLWMKLYRKAFLDRHKLRFREEFYSKADVIFHWRSMSLAERVSVVPEPLYHYRVHENSITGTIGKRFIQVIDVMEAIKHDLIELKDPRGLLPGWYTFALSFIYGAYQQLAPEYRPEMRDALRSFLDRLDDDERRVITEPGRLPQHVRYFYLSLESPRAAFRYGTLYRWRKGVSRSVRNAVLPAPLRRKLLGFVRSQSYNLSRSSADELRDSVRELNESLNRLAAENYRLRQRLSPRSDNDDED